jgi:RNA polymerase-binding protein DksA
MDDVNPEEDGTDAHMRTLTLQQVNVKTTMLAKIDEALRAISKGTYGICDSCGNLIRKQRLQAQPFSKTCIHCQSEMERGRLK